MIAYSLRRLAVSIPTLAGVATISFLLMRLIPGDPARVIAGPTATPEDVEQIRRQVGLTGPLWAQYLTFMVNLLHGNLGTSSRTGQPVLTEILSRAPNTLLLACVSVALAVVVGCALGIVAASRANTVVDAVISSISVFGVSMPVYWIGLLLIIAFAVNLHWLPSAGAGEPLSFLLPSITLASFAIGFISRQTRSAMLEVLKQDYIRTARAKGCGRILVLYKHALRNALLPIVTIVGLQFGQLLGGAVLTETIFAWPGLGRLLFDSIAARDYATVQGSVFVFALALIVLNLLVDLTNAYVDPRIRYN